MNDDVPDEDQELREKIQELRIRHRDLDDAIKALISSGTSNMIQLQRFKKQKLNIKDTIVGLQNQLLPDIIA